MSVLGWKYRLWVIRTRIHESVVAQTIHVVGQWLAARLYEVCTYGHIPSSGVYPRKFVDGAWIGFYSLREIRKFHESFKRPGMQAGGDSAGAA